MTVENEVAGRGAGSQLYKNVTCPFCGMHCDDLEIERIGAELKVRKNGCSKAVAGFERVLPPARPMVEGREVGLDDAIAAAARLVRNATLPLFGGLATDVEGMRAAMALADRAGGVVDHALSDAQYRNFRVLQTSGWITSTFTEVRNRADLVVIVGTDAHRLHPRFFERIICPPDSLFDAPVQKRTIVFLGTGLDASAATGPRIGEVVTLPCALDRVGEVLGALRARLRGAPVGGTEIAGLPLADIDALAERCRKAHYGVMVWAPPSLNFPNADLTVHLLSEVVKDLNVTTRFAGLSLGGNEGAVTAGAVCGWQSGYPLRVSYARGSPDFDPLRYSAGWLLAGREADLLVWVASISPKTTPPEAPPVSTVLLGTPGTTLSRPPAVFIPVGTPGVDHAGSMVRVDNVVSLPLHNLGRSALPRVADVLAAVEAAL